jgi:hypothetical protein
VHRTPLSPQNPPHKHRYPSRVRSRERHHHSKRTTRLRPKLCKRSIPSDRHAPKALYQSTSLSTSQLQQSRSSRSMSSMVFNQESSYPVHVLQSNATRRRRTASQTGRAISSTSLTDADVMPPPPPPSRHVSRPPNRVNRRILCHYIHNVPGERLFTVS